jgi:hypothetical protein
MPSAPATAADEPPAIAEEAAPACAQCGGGEALDFGTLWLCLACYHVAGSTCAGVRTTPGGGSTC